MHVLLSLLVALSPSVSSVPFAQNPAAAFLLPTSTSTSNSFRISAQPGLCKRARCKNLLLQDLKSKRGEFHAAQQSSRDSYMRATSEEHTAGYLVERRMAGVRRRWEGKGEMLGFEKLDGLTTVSRHKLDLMDIAEYQVRPFQGSHLGLGRLE